MARICVLLVVVAACHHGATDDECEIVANQPDNAMATIAKHHEGDPAAAAEIIEKCLAPTGDDCERLQKIIPALPKLMPASGASPSAAQIASLCKDAMTPEMRRCMFPSYTLRHADECAQVLQKLQASHTKLDIKPAPSCNLPPLTVAIDRAGVDVGKQHKDGALDKDWLEQQLKPYAGGDCMPAVVVRASDGVPYQDVVTAMDMATKVGLTNVSLDAPGSALGSANAPLAQDADLKSKPVVVVTKTEVLVGKDVIAKVADVAKADGYTIPALAKRPPPLGDGVVLLQADENTDVRVINKIVATLKAVGFHNVLFVVKNP